MLKPGCEWLLADPTVEEMPQQVQALASWWRAGRPWVRHPAGGSPGGGSSNGASSSAGARLPRPQLRSPLASLPDDALDTVVGPFGEKLGLVALASLASTCRQLRAYAALRLPEPPAGTGVDSHHPGKTDCWRQAPFLPWRQLEVALQLKRSELLRRRQQMDEWPLYQAWLLQMDEWTQAMSERQAQAQAQAQQAQQEQLEQQAQQEVEIPPRPLLNGADMFKQQAAQYPHVRVQLDDLPRPGLLVLPVPNWRGIAAALPPALDAASQGGSVGAARLRNARRISAVIGGIIAQLQRLLSADAVTVEEAAVQ